MKPLARINLSSVLSSVLSFVALAKEEASCPPKHVVRRRMAKEDALCSGIPVSSFMLPDAFKCRV